MGIPIGAGSVSSTVVIPKSFRANANKQPTGGARRANTSGSLGSAAGSRAQGAARQRGDDYAKLKAQEEKVKQQAIAERYAIASQAWNDNLNKKGTAEGAANEAADSLEKSQNKQDEAEERKEANLATDSEDQFMADFQKYSDANLGGMGLYDFLAVDPMSQEDRDAWQSFWDDDTMGSYYQDQKDEYGTFDAYWDAMMANTIDQIMASQDLQRDYFNNTGGDSMTAIFQGLAHDGFIPTVSGDQWQIDELSNLYANDTDLAALTMMYQYGMDALLNDEALDLDVDPDAVAKLNDYMQLGNMEFGLGDDYSTEVNHKDRDSYVTNTVSYDDYKRSAEDNLAAVPGYGLPEIGLRSLMYDRYGTGYKMRPGVEALYESSGEE